MSPTTGQVIQTGNSFNIRYTSSQYVGFGYAEVYKGSTKITTLTSVYPNTNYPVSTAGYQIGVDYRVKVYDYTNTSNSAWSNYFRVEAISAPTANAASSISYTSFTANWTAVPGADNYFIDISTTNDFSSFVTGYNNLNTSSLTGGPISKSIN
ncbi:MAG: hypothetical protein ACKO96_35405, partial [Flammeovirgaceae bacterium]